MCGICGIVSLQGKSGITYISAVEKMCAAMEHRGPDDSSVKVVGSSCIGHRRLSILDTSSHGCQPFISQDSSVGMVANGEIYNYIAYRKLLKSKGCKFDSDSDSEVILHGYSTQGEDFINSLRGMFALAVHDKKKNLTLIARDRQGIKPVYYYVDNQFLIFASEIKAILKSGLIEHKLNPLALQQFVQFGYVPEPDSLVLNVKMLEPGHLLRLQDQTLSIEPYWKWPEQDAQSVPPSTLIKQTRQYLEDSINVHLQSDVPMGVFLSGGIDSTIITGLASELSDVPINTFSLGFHENRETIGETEIARRISQFYKTHHHEYILSGQDVYDNLGKIIDAMSQPSFDGINTYFISKVAREAGMKVALSGLGGDELFGGYGTFQFLPRYGRLVKLWSYLSRNNRHRLIVFMQRFFNNSFHKEKISRMKDVNDFVDFYFMIRGNGVKDDTQNIFSNSVSQLLIQSNSTSTSIIQCLKNGEKFTDLWRETQRLEMKNYMQWRLLRDADAMSMIHSLEVRVPLIDDYLVDHILSLPQGWNRRLGWPKKLLVNSMKDMIPGFVLNRKKQGFQLPMDIWMRNELKPIVEDVFSVESIRSRGIFEESYLLDLYQRFKRSQLPYEQIWKFVVLELWLRKMDLKI
jgi:asparagine synthase (glutamine-hydrolysing)